MYNHTAYQVVVDIYQTKQSCKSTKTKSTENSNVKKITTKIWPEKKEAIVTKLQITK